MKKMIVTGIAGIMALASAAVPASAQFAGVKAPAAAASADTGDLLQVQRRYRDDRRYYRDDRRYYRHRHRDSNAGAAVAAGVLGLAAGAAIASSANRGNADDRWCAERFRSYDSRSGTYLGADGRRHACP
ncbi:BA14K family protein [Terrihabitans sp. B22-R8]|uniref:BA14K family protein n=1 Tax=Terrihabitans sp. B22-R8 TaxID=3425128 RepID=UPI00403CF94C